VRVCGTTICCSAVALTLLGLRAADAPPPAGLFPIRALWTIPLNNSLTAPPVYDGVRGYYPIEGNRIVAYDFDTGRQLWLAASLAAFQPAAGGGRLFVPTAAGLSALDGQTGSAIWDAPLGDALAVPLLFDSGWLIAATVNGTIHAMTADDGREIWTYRAGATPSGRPALSAGRLYVPLADRRLVALRADDGQPIWERRLGGEPRGLLALDERLYAGATDNYLYCLRADTGETDWRWRTGGDIVGAPVADDDRVYFVSLDNILRGLTRSGGTQQWKRTLPLRPKSGPLLAGDALIVSGLSPTLRAYSKETGAPVGEVALGAELAAPPHLVLGADGPVLVAVSSDIVKGAVVGGFSRAMEPAAAPLTALPNPVPAPAAPIP
jgi:outer membrane protein assembly factor BamB